MFSKEVQELTKPLVEAIKVIAERQEKECPRCEGTGHRIRKILSESSTPKPTKCDKCSGSGKLKRKWKWEPEPGEWFTTEKANEGKPLLVEHITLGGFIKSSVAGLDKQINNEFYVSIERIAEEVFPSSIGRKSRKYWRGWDILWVHLWE